ncbi:hypothetical protein I7I51_05759 [Histoplasma capsulatum]|uniref:Uncharacterized protein n=1 Tax=Ajellomyces capsulatus TaxID=5037 RepID=A0A8A1M887_AJECA|nr:hypothetical protein I7I51_05759 [Histoplasma capsulatum]
MGLNKSCYIQVLEEVKIPERQMSKEIKIAQEVPSVMGNKGAAQKCRPEYTVITQIAAIISHTSRDTVTGGARSPVATDHLPGNITCTVM